MLRQLLRRTRPTANFPTHGRALSSSASSVQRIYVSPHEPLDLTPRTAWDIVSAASELHADKPALICGVTHEHITHREFIEGVKAIATSLSQRGVTKGTVVLTNVVNCLEYPQLYHALTLLGATMSPSAPQFSAAELVRQIHASKATFVVTHEAVEAPMKEAVTIAAIPNDNVFCAGVSPSHFQHFSVLQTPSGGAHVRGAAVDIMNDINYLPFSSGTTGAPKGVKLSFWNMAINMLQMGHGESFDSPAMVVLPYYHIYASTLMNMVLATGQAQVVLPRFDHHQFLHCLERYRISKAHIVPPIATFLAKHPTVDEYDLSALKTLVSAAAPLGAGLEEAVRGRLGIQVKQCYGLTELSPIVNYSKDGDLKKASTGTLVPNTELRVVCPSSGHDLPPGRVGELWYRGPQVMQGYLDNDHATASTTTTCGFLKTGDLGYIDDDGHVFVVDRLKELIKYKGHQVAPAELEDVIMTHPSIMDVACIRGYNDDGEEVPKACVVVKPDHTLSADDLMEFVAARVAPFKKVRQVAFVAAIPKNGSGKILRRELQATQRS